MAQPPFKVLHWAIIHSMARKTQAELQGIRKNSQVGFERNETQQGSDNSILTRRHQRTLLALSQRYASGT